MRSDSDRAHPSRPDADNSISIEPAVVDGPAPLPAVNTRPDVENCHRYLGEAVCRKLGIFSLPDRFRLTVIVPVFNEQSTVEKIVDRVIRVGIPTQLILVDDGSRDGTSEALLSLVDRENIEVITHAINRGKGAAIRTALPQARGDVIVIQDADQEYDPEDFWWLLQPIVEGDADVVYGTRYGHHDRQLSPWWHQAVNGFLTTLAGIAVGLKLSDVETCYKMATRDAWMAIAPDLKENRFGIEIELTARWARRKFRFYERPIRYRHRWFDEGKKIGWRDGVAAIFCIVKYGLFRG